MNNHWDKIFQQKSLPFNELPPVSAGIIWAMLVGLIVLILAVSASIKLRLDYSKRTGQAGVPQRTISKGF